MSDVCAQGRWKFWPDSGRAQGLHLARLRDDRQTHLCTAWLLACLAALGAAAGCRYPGAGVRETRRLTADLSAVVVPFGCTKSVRCTFEIPNETDRTLYIVPRVIPCYALQVRLSKRRLAPGETAQLTLGRRVGNLLRPDTLSLKVLVDRSDGVRYECAASFLAVPRIEVLGSVALGPVSPGMAKSFETKVRLNVETGEGGNWSLQVDRLPARPYTTRVRLSEAQRRVLYPGIETFEYALRGQLEDVSLLSPVPLPYDTYTLLAVKGNHVERRAFRVSWQPQNFVIAEPARVTLTTGSPVFRVRVRAADGASFRITGWYVRDVSGRRMQRWRAPLDDVRWMPGDGPSDVYDVLATVRRDYRTPWFELVLTTDRRDQPIVPVAVLKPGPLR